MNQTITEEQDTQAVETIESETILHIEPEILLPIAEYAALHSLSRRTVDRYVQIGRLESKKQHGRTMILDKPLKPQPTESRQVRTDIDSQLVPLAQTDWMQLGYFKARSKAKTIWQTYAIVVTILLFAFVLAAVCLYMQLRFITTTPL